MKKIVTIVVIIFLILTSVPLISGSNNDLDYREKNLDSESKNETNYYAIIAACSEYNDSDLNIPRFIVPPHEEWKLKIFYNNLIKADNWNEENIILLINEEATNENIKNAFNEMANRVNENDVFLFSWQGHGSKIKFQGDDNYRGVIIPHDGIYISDYELDYMFSDINSKGQFIIFDCCFSGKIIKNLAREQRVLVALTEEDIGLIDLFIGFPMTISLALGINPNILSDQKDKNNNAFLSAQEIFNWCEPIIKIATRSWIIQIIFINFLIAKITNRVGVFSRIKTIFSTIFSTLVGYIIYQSGFFYKYNSFAKNSPHMIDMYNGELDIIKI